MVQSYFEYTLKQCDDSVIPDVCIPYKTKSELLKKATTGFNGNRYILGRDRLVSAAAELIAENGYIVISALGRDAEKLYLRIERNIKEMEKKIWNHIDIDQERLFDILVDLNWLISSIYIHEQRGERGDISLLTSSTTICKGIKKGLSEVLYENALYEQDRSEQYETAQMTRYAFLPGMHPDPQVRDYFGQGYTYSDFKSLQEKARECSIRKMALFYGLTATAAKAEQIRRMG